MAIQAHIPPALGAIHNFIWIHDPNEIHDEHIDIEPYGELAPGPAGWQEIARGTARWDIIAQSMWESYLLELQMHGM